MDREQAKEKIDALIASAKDADPTLFACRDAVVRRVAGVYVKPPFKGQEARIFWELMSEVERQVRALRELGLRDEVIEKIMGVKK